MRKVEFNRIALQSDKLLVGMAAKVSVAKDATPVLWQRFMPRRKEIQSTVNEVLYSVQNFSQFDGFKSFAPETVFEKWAAVEVANRDCVPDGMQLFVLQAGHYAVFDHYGPPSEFSMTRNFIFSEWMPKSEWQLDDREHFEILRPDWRADDPNAREEVWIPVKSDENV
ncbi:MAG: GyrI-like domain-containing protein [SAR86 cluster bacterium]|uniref:GyrI-like domain-containing protein n=1 Tax=SAR86 cluster bacterium TaxID=2030880 RepID=A0A2A4X2U2_9GAMM|nr:MAG: GyrI-like domain-containing protein [SAR86 cluster bacterium]